MGFPENRATRACIAVHYESMERAIAWIENHENDADIDDPITESGGNVLGSKTEGDNRWVSKAFHIRQHHPFLGLSYCFKRLTILTIQTLYPFLRPPTLYHGPWPSTPVTALTPYSLSGPVSEEPAYIPLTEEQMEAKAAAVQEKLRERRAITAEKERQVRQGHYL